MRLITRTAAAAAAAAAGLLLGLACSKDANAPPVPAIVAIAAGDGQSGSASTALGALLTVGVIGSDSQPFGGATVIWSVTAGAASVNPSTSVTDTNGLASTAVTLGSVAGPVTVQASVGSLAPVNFSAIVLTPCTTGVAYTFGTLVNGALATTDCTIGKFYADLYLMNLANQTSMTISEASGSFDTFLELYANAGHPIAGNDDYQATTDSRVKIFLSPGDYLLAPSSFDTLVTGPYSLNTALTPQTLGACEESWVGRGVAWSEFVHAKDCVDSGATYGPYYSDRVLMLLDSGTVLTAHEASTDFDAYLIFADLGSSFFTFNDDSAAGVTNSYLVVQVPHNSLYLLDIGTFDVADTGSYSFDISSATTLAGAAGQGVKRSVQTFRIPRGMKTPFRSVAPIWTERRRTKPSP